MAKQTEQQKRNAILMKQIRQYDKDWKKGKIIKQNINFGSKYNHTLPSGSEVYHYYYNNRYSPNIFEERIQEIKIPVEIPQKAVVLGDIGCFYLDGTGDANNGELKRMIRDKEVPDVGVRQHILHSSCFSVKHITLQLKVHTTLRTPPQTEMAVYPHHHFNNSWWFWYLEELTKYEEKGRAFDLLMKHSNLCEDVIGLIGEYL